MIETRITKAVINESKQLVVSFICKEGDYTLQELELLRQAKINGDLLDLSIEGLVNGDKEKEKTELRQRLGLLMKEYSTLFHLDESEVIKKLYNKYNVKSRTSLTYEQLEQEVDSFKTAIINKTP